MQVEDIVRKFTPDLVPFVSIYKDIHKHPELSCGEERTASVVAEKLQNMGFGVHQNIGGHGVVGVLENGPGKVVMWRAELDALPIKEQTELPYSSNHSMVDMWGREQPVMHACGHDMHMACLLAAAKLLHDAREQWNGTLQVLFQPNEEHTGGAQAMISGGLYDKVSKPDVVFAQHLIPMPSGSVSILPGPVLASADTVKVRIFSSEGRRINPNVAVEVSLVACKIIMRMQSLVEELAKDGYAAFRVDEIHAGGPGMDFVPHLDMVLDVKAYTPEIREKLLSGVKEVVEDEATSSGAAKKPEITYSVRAPLTSNDEKIAGTLKVGFETFFGRNNVLDDVPRHPCEDFSILAREIQAPYVYWFLGKADPTVLDEARKEGKFLDKIPLEHSPFNAPLIHPTLETGMNALCIAALSTFKN